MEHLKIQTNERIELVNITSKIEKFVESKKTGICFIFVPHATAALIMQEDEEGLKRDIENKIKEIFFQGNYEHDKIDNNAASHIKAAILGPSETIHVKDGKLQLGQWQDISFIELDGPRTERKIIVEVIGS